jgi:hypothetical protein
MHHAFDEPLEVDEGDMNYRSGNPPPEGGCGCGCSYGYPDDAALVERAENPIHLLQNPPEQNSWLANPLVQGATAGALSSGVDFAIGRYVDASDKGKWLSLGLKTVGAIMLTRESHEGWHGVGSGLAAMTGYQMGALALGKLLTPKAELPPPAAAPAPETAADDKEKTEGYYPRPQAALGAQPDHSYARFTPEQQHETGYWIQRQDQYGNVVDMYMPGY